MLVLCLRDWLGADVMFVFLLGVHGFGLRGHFFFWTFASAKFVWVYQMFLFYSYIVIPPYS